MIVNYGSFIAFVISVVCLAIYMCFLAPRQAAEVLRPRDWLTRLRWIILSMILISIVTAIPSTIYQFYRSIGTELEFLRGVSTVSGQVSKLATTILLILVFTYRGKVK